MTKIRVCLSSCAHFYPFFLTLFLLSGEGGRGRAADHVHVCMLVRAHACVCVCVSVPMHLQDLHWRGETHTSTPPTACVSGRGQERAVEAAADSEWVTV